MLLNTHTILRVLFLASILVPLATIPSVVPPVHAVGVLFISPASQPALSKGSTFKLQVNVSNIDPFDTWDIYVTSDTSSIKPTAVSVSGNIGSATEFVNCVNGVGNGCTIIDGAGVAHSEATINSGLASGSGLLFTITYQVVGDGYSFITITAGRDLLYLSGILVSHLTLDGSYGNTPTNLPVADFTISPAAPVSNGTLTLNVTSVSDPNQGASITTYAWTIINAGGGSITNVTRAPIMVHRLGVSEFGDLIVTLVVTDSLGLSSRATTHLVAVSEQILHRLVVNAIRATPTDNILAGTQVNITVSILNKGTVSEKGFNVTILLEGVVLRTFDDNTTVILRGHTVGRSFLLSTTGWQPGTYDLVATASNDTRANAYLTLRIIIPYQGAPIPFTVPEFIGLIVSVLVALGLVRFLLARSREKRRILAQELA